MSGFGDCTKRNLKAEAGRAHTELLFLELSEEMIFSIYTQDPSIGSVLRLCQQMFLSSLVDKQSIFLRFSCLSSEDAERIHNEVIELCKKMRAIALPLVESFAVPPHLLGPIAFDWIEHNAKAKM
eukprot:jgi/Galph1/3091/GphlegSOOS_G1739.1